MITRHYPMPGRAVRYDPGAGTVLEPVTILKHHHTQRSFTVRFRDGETVTLPADYVLRGVRGEPGADRRRVAHSSLAHRHVHGRR